MNFPNYLTLARLVMVPILVIVFYLPFHWHYFVSALIFVLAALTDWLDGFLARRLKQQTAFGAFFDPVADKIMVVTVLCLLIADNHSIWITLPALVIIGREIIISALREWMAELGKRGSIAVSFLGKLKTVVQMTTITLMLLTKPEVAWLFYLSTVMLYLSAFLTLWSMIIYLKLAWPQFELS